MQERYLQHHGVQGQKWGVRRYQNADGSLTAAGRRRYGADDINQINTQRGIQNRLSDISITETKNDSVRQRYSKRSGRTKNLSKQRKYQNDINQINNKENELDKEMKSLIAKAESKKMILDVDHGNNRKSIYATKGVSKEDITKHLMEKATLNGKDYAKAIGAASLSAIANFAVVGLAVAPLNPAAGIGAATGAAVTGGMKVGKASLEKSKLKKYNKFQKIIKQMDELNYNPANGAIIKPNEF